MRTYILIGMLLLPLAACSGDHQNEGMKTQLDSIRVMIKQSALMAANAACAETGDKTMLIHAAAVQARRAMGGPEMAKIHKMMNMQPDTTGAGMNMSKNGKEPMSAEMNMHVALHDAGEDVFDFLDGMGETPAISCQQAAPVSMAASAAMLREANGGEASTTANKLDQSVTTMLNKQDDTLIPPQVRTLTLALQHI